MVHRDLKLENVLLSTADPDNMFNIKVVTCRYNNMSLCPCSCSYNVHMYASMCIHLYVRGVEKEREGGREGGRERERDS